MRLEIKHPLSEEALSNDADIDRLLANLRSDDVWVRYGAVQALRNVGVAANAALIAVALDPRESPFSRLAAIESLDQSDEIDNSIRELLRSDDAAIVCCSIRAAVRLNRSGLLPDIQALEGDDRWDYAAHPMDDSGCVCDAAQWAIQQLSSNQLL